MAQSSVANRTAAVQASSSQILQASFAALLGLGLFIGVALSHPAAIHNAAHDSRHGIAVPCH